MSKNKITEHEHFRDLILEEYKKGNVIFKGIDLQSCPLTEFVEQPVDGLLYDLNRSEEVVLTFIEDRKWINDYAVCKVIRELKRQIEELKKK